MNERRDFNRCFGCGSRAGNQDGSFCTTLCREKYDDGEPGYYQNYLREPQKPVKETTSHKGISSKEALQSLSTHLDISPNTIKRIDGQWKIAGRQGDVYANQDRWYVSVAAKSDQHRTSLNRRLSFMKLQGGEYSRERMPSSELAEIVRKVVGLNKRPIITSERKKALQALASANRGVPSHKFPNKSGGLKAINPGV